MMLHETLNPPTFKDRAARKLRRLLSGVRKIGLKSPPMNHRFLNAAAWCMHGELATRVVFFNYFWRSHHEEVIRLDMQLIDVDGRELWRQSKMVMQDQTLIIDSADIAESIGVAKFEGYLAFSSNMSRVPEFIELIRFNVDYYTARGSISTVHDQAIFAAFYPPTAHSLGKMEVVENQDVGTALIFTNSLSFCDIPISARVEVRRHDGSSLHIGNFAIPARAMRRIELGKIQPDLEHFLQGKPGQVIAESNYYVKRAAVVQYSKSGIANGFSVNHSEEYRGNPPYLNSNLSSPALEARMGPMVPVPFFHNYQRLSTELVVFHDVAGAGPYQSYGVTLFDESGNQIFHDENVVTVALHGTARVRVKDLIPGKQEMFGLAQIFLAPASSNQRWTESFPAYVHYILHEGMWDAMYSQGSVSSLNAGEGSRTRVFCRAYHDNTLKTELIFFHASTSVDEKNRVPQSSTQVTLCDPTGRMAITRELCLKPFSTCIVKLEQLFPEIENFGMKPGMACGIYVRDVKAKIIGAHVTRNADNTAIAVDHFFGG
jgi:hypothetical protein